MHNSPDGALLCCCKDTGDSVCSGQRLRSSVCSLHGGDSAPRVARDQKTGNRSLVLGSPKRENGFSISILVESTEEHKQGNFKK